VVSRAVFEIPKHKAIENSLFSQPHPCLTPPLRGIPLKFLDETYPAKTRGMGLLYGENCTILTSTVLDWSTRVSDGRTDDSIYALQRINVFIYAVARKKKLSTKRSVEHQEQQTCRQSRSTELSVHRMNAKQGLLRRHDATTAFYSYQPDEMSINNIQWRRVGQCRERRRRNSTL